MFIFAQEEPLLEHYGGLFTSNKSNKTRTYIDHAIFSTGNTAAFNFMKDNFRALKKKYWSLR